MEALFHHLPQLPYTLRAIVILATGVILLRLVGKRSIAQLTIPESVFIIAIGTILIQPIGNTNEWAAIYGGLILVLGMMLLSWLQIRFPALRKAVYGVPTVLIKQGELDLKNLKKVKMTTNQLDMRLRMLGVVNLKDVKTAILEPSGQLSISLTEAKKTADKGDIQAVLSQLSTLQMQLLQLTSGSSTLTQSYTNILKSQPERLFAQALDESERDLNLTKN
jgi:uncharacterized membrane protein YcaP (DUF421 family)